MPRFLLTIPKTFDDFEVISLLGYKQHNASLLDRENGNCFISYCIKQSQRLPKKSNVKATLN